MQKNRRMVNYKKQMDDRLLIINSCNSKICYVPKIKGIPESIFYQSLPEDSTSGNSFYCEHLGSFYNKRWIFTND
jgi:hypothetical protein